MQTLKSEVAKMNKTYRECAIDYIKNRHLFKQYVDYIVAQLNKLDKIEQIIADYDGSIPSMIKQFSELQKVLEENN